MKEEAGWRATSSSCYVPAQLPCSKCRQMRSAAHPGLKYRDQAMHSCTAALKGASKCLSRRRPGQPQWR